MERETNVSKKNEKNEKARPAGGGIASVTTIGSVSNDAEPDIQQGVPYVVEVGIVGTAAMLFHRWSCDAVEEKAKAAKGSKAKKSDNVESYVYRDEATKEICLPGEYIRQSIIMAAKYRQDPRSPRKSAMDLYKAGVVTMTELCSLGTDVWDYLDRRRVVVQRNAVTRMRPAMRAGWKATCQLQILLPEYIDVDSLSDVLTNAGRLVGVGDFRPTFGRFRLEKFEKMSLDKAA